MPSVRVPSPTPPPVPREDRAPRKGMNLPGADLRGADLRGANLQGADLTGARLAWARLTGAKLQGATLQGADLSETDLWMADLRGANLQKADLRGAKLTPGDQVTMAEESAGEAISMVPAPGEARSEIPVEILDPRRIVAEIRSDRTHATIGRRNSPGRRETGPSAIAGKSSPFPTAPQGSFPWR